MAKSNEVSKSQSIRDLLQTNRKMPTKDVIAALASKGIKVRPSLVYLIKSQLRSRKRRQVRNKVKKVTGNGDAVAMIRKVKALASEVGGMKKLQELMEALSA